jgi:plasmid stabilization system protein ParE
VTFRVRTLRRAAADILSITDYIYERSPQGAAAWVNALVKARSRLSDNAETCGEADENERFDIDLKQSLFKTRRGRVYRLVFTIVGDEIRILRVRGSGQSPIEPGDI